MTDQHEISSTDNKLFLMQMTLANTSTVCKVKNARNRYKTTKLSVYLTFEPAYSITADTAVGNRRSGSMDLIA